MLVNKRKIKAFSRRYSLPAFNRPLLIAFLVGVMAILSVSMPDEVMVNTIEATESHTEGKFHSIPYNPDICTLNVITCYNEKVFTISAYNTVKWQTDNSPCISASGDNICGRDDIVACPRKYKFGTIFTIQGKDYICLDRLSNRFDNRLDISFDKDITKARQWGIKNLEVIIK